MVEVWRWVGDCGLISGKLVGICEERGKRERNEMVKGGCGWESDIYLDDKEREKEAQNENGSERERW